MKHFIFHSEHIDTLSLFFDETIASLRLSGARVDTNFVDRSLFRSTSTGHIL